MARHRCIRPVLGVGAVVAALAASGAGWAQYKIVGPDGRVTYTDTLRPADAARATPLKISGMASTDSERAGAVAHLPSELREPVSRFPVVLYSQRGCQPCDTARTLLQTRGIPFSEKLITSDADFRQLAKLTGGDRSLPMLTIGQQLLRGLNSITWNSNLDAAGYPKTSRLPANYRQPPAVALAASAPASAELPVAPASKAKP